MTCIQKHSHTLRARGFRMTPQRVAILQTLHDGGHLSPAQVYERTRPGLPGLTETTVYRTLEFLAENDIVHPAQEGSGHLTYELAGHDHHHLVCRACGAQAGIEPALLQKTFAQIERQTGYQINAGHITFFGLCPKCKPVP
jgi:Fur family transcriptional regulator, ferric uptake regulator